MSAATPEGAACLQCARSFGGDITRGVPHQHHPRLGLVLGNATARRRRTIGASDNPAVLGGMRAKNNGRYNGNGREWRTPSEVFEPLHREFDFTLDPCTTADNYLCLPKFYTELEDGLEQSWAGERVFMNPPYGREVYAWTRKARQEAAAGALVVGLLPASTDLRWWHEDVVGHAEVRYIRGRVRFLTGGPYRASGFFPSVVVIWRPHGLPVSQKDQP